MKARSTVLLVCLLATAASAQHEGHGPTPVLAPAATAPYTFRPARSWTQQPLLLPGKIARGDRAGAVLRAQGIVSAALTVYAPEGPVERLKVDYPNSTEGARIATATPKIGNYHWITAREESADTVKMASTAWYFGNPGDSPKDLLKTVKHELEIVPAPLPREHGLYRESEKWRFLLRFKGQPLAGQTLTLETEFGSRSNFLTDAAGFATVLFPRDFKPVAKDAGGHAGHGPRRGKFVLATEKQDGDKRYLTAFNLSYGEDGDRDKSLGWGATFGLIGMLAATPLLRRRKDKQNNSGDTHHA